MFTEKEVAYLQSPRLARIATVAPDGQPDVTPVGFEFDGDRFYVGGRNLEETRKYQNVAAGNRKVALVIDDLASVNPWRPRGIRVYGEAEPVERKGRLGQGTYLSIRPRISWSWDVEDAGLHRTRHSA